MSNINKEKEDIDIVQLFRFLSRSANAFFNVVRNSFVDFVLYLKKRVVIWAGVAVVFIVVNQLFFNKNEDIAFRSSILIKPNFGSGYLMYSKIQYFNYLIGRRDYDELSKELDIDIELAKKLRVFRVMPVIEYNKNVEIFLKLVTEKENVNRQGRLLEFKDYENHISKENKFLYNLQKVSLESSELPKGSYVHIKNGFIKSCDSDFMLDRQKVHVENVKKEIDNIDQKINSDISLILNQEYSSDKQNDVNINNVSNRGTIYDLVLSREELQKKSSELKVKLEEYKHVLTPLSNFSDIESISLISNPLISNIFKGIILGLLSAILLDLSLFIRREEKRRKENR